MGEGEEVLTGGFLLDMGTEGGEFTQPILLAAFVEELGKGPSGDDEGVVGVESLVVIGVQG